MTSTVTNADKIRVAIEWLGLSDGQFVVGGSGVLALRGIRDARDVDLYVKESVFDGVYLVETGFSPLPDVRRIELVVAGIDVVVMKDWKWDGYPVALREALRSPEYVDEVPCVPLNYLLIWKQYAGSRPKDAADVRLIEEYLASGGT